MIRTPPGKLSIDGASRFRLDVMRRSANLLPRVRRQNGPGDFFYRQFNLSSICGRFGRPPFFPFSLDAFRLAGEVLPAAAFPAICARTLRISAGVIGIL